MSDVRGGRKYLSLACVSGLRLDAKVKRKAFPLLGIISQLTSRSGLSNRRIRINNRGLRSDKHK